MDCCEPDNGQTQSDTCHQPPAMPMQCQEIRAIRCVDAVCEPDRAFASVLISAGIDAFSAALPVALPVSPIPVPESRDLFEPGKPEFPRSSGRVFLRNCALLI